jgi:uncharacterized protein
MAMARRTPGAATHGGHGASPAGAEGCTVERVGFTGDRAHLIGNLFLPAGRDESLALPAVGVTGTWTSVKEQMADRYAAKIAARGVAALSFDFTGFGMSGGEL